MTDPSADIASFIIYHELDNLRGIDEFESLFNHRNFTRAFIGQDRALNWLVQSFQEQFNYEYSEYSYIEIPPYAINELTKAVKAALKQKPTNKDRKLIIVYYNYVATIFLLNNLKGRDGLVDILMCEKGIETFAKLLRKVSSILEEEKILINPLKMVENLVQKCKFNCRKNLPAVREQIKHLEPTFYKHELRSNEDYVQKIFSDMDSEHLQEVLRDRATNTYTHIYRKVLLLEYGIGHDLYENFDPVKAAKRLLLEDVEYWRSRFRRGAMPHRDIFTRDVKRYAKFIPEVLTIDYELSEDKVLLSTVGSLCM